MSTPSPQKLFALLMLERVRQFQAKHTDADAEIDLAEPPAKSASLLPPDKATYAVQLSFCLAEHFLAVEALLASKAFVVIKTRASDDPVVVADVLYEIAVFEGGSIAVNPQRHLRSSDRLVLIADARGAFSGGSTRSVAEAARRGLPVICVASPDAVLPDALKGADLYLELPAINAEMLQLVFSACHSEIGSDDLTAIKPTGKLTVSDLAGHIRPGRSSAACLASLQHAISARNDALSTVSTVTLKELAGYGEAQTWGLELVEDFALWRKNQLSWEDFEHRAVVLAGPPGTGKTSFATVLAESLKVPMVASSVAEWNGHDHLSGTLRRMQAVFDEAIAKAPCVLLIDEIDGISSRDAIGGRYSQYWTQIVNLMLELVTKAMATPGVIIVGATNHVERIDPALMRAGRLDRIIRIEPPDAAAIAAILARYVGPTIPPKDLNAVAVQLVGKTGADIEKLVRSARASARRAGHAFSVSDLWESVSDPFYKLPAQTQRRIAIYRAGQFVTGQVLGFIGMDGQAAKRNLRGLADNFVRNGFDTEQVCNDMLAMIMAGRAAEEIVFGDVSVFGSGSADSDLALATELARDLEMASGFGDCGLVYLDLPALASVLPATVVGSIHRRIEAAKTRASALLLENRAELEATAARVLHGVNSYEERAKLRRVH